MMKMNANLNQTPLSTPNRPHRPGTSPILVAFLVFFGMSLAFSSVAMADRGTRKHCDNEPVAITAPDLTAQEWRRMDKPALIDKRTMRQRIKDMQQNVDELALLARNARHPRMRDALYRQVDAMQADLDQMRAELRRAERVKLDNSPPPRRPRYDKPVKPRRPEPASPQTFSSIYRTLDQTPFHDDRMETLESIARRQHFTTAQVSRIAKLFPFHDDRLAALKLLYTRTVDQENYHQLYALLPHRSDRRQLVHFTSAR